MKTPTFLPLLALLLLISAPSCRAMQSDSLLVVTDSLCTDSLCTADSLSTAAIEAADTASTTLASDSITRPNPYLFKPLQLILPGSLIGVGLLGLHNGWILHQNKSIREELQEDIDRRLTLDDITQYVPTVAPYALNLCGIRGQHSYADLTIILGTAYALMGISVNALKYTTRIERPDGSSRNSFPSGHTATAFLGAEILRREYWKVSPWIGIAGYAVAAGTGFFRMYNNRHWLTDVVAGAGFGILSAQAAYWLYPTIAKTFFPKRYRKNVFLAPYVSKESRGLNLSFTF